MTRAFEAEPSPDDRVGDSGVESVGECDGHFDGGQRKERDMKQEDIIYQKESGRSALPSASRGLKDPKSNPVRKRYVYPLAANHQ